ncbi:MAG: Abi family protein, partial [Acutalibacteraceae bacterium]
DEYLRNIFLHKIINIEKLIKSLYSYSFCQIFGETQLDYLNINNYNYNNDKYRSDINKYVSKLEEIINNPDKYPYIDYNISTYGTVPFWIIIQALTFGTISKLFTFSQEQLQSKISREFNLIYPKQLSSMLSVLTKFRNVCAHGERLYNYKTKKSLLDLPFHKENPNCYSKQKNDLFNVCICFKYLLPFGEFKGFINLLNGFMQNAEKELGNYYFKETLNSMGFPENWKDLLLN